MSEDDSKRYLHISDVGELFDEELAKLDASEPHGPVLQYLGTVTCANTTPRIDLATVQSALDAIETLYPRKSIASYMKMSRSTHDEFLKRINPWKIDPVDFTSEQMTALEFNGVQLRVDDTMPYGFIDICNSEDEVIKVCRL